MKNLKLFLMFIAMFFAFAPLANAEENIDNKEEANVAETITSDENGKDTKSDVVTSGEVPSVKATRAAYTVTVNYNDMRIEGTTPQTETYSSNSSKSLTNMYKYLGFTSSTGSYINELDEEGNDTYYTYVFNGWFTSDGTKLGYEDYTSVDGVNFKIYNRTQVSNLAIQVPELEENKEINLYARWTKVYKPLVTIHIYDTKYLHENLEVKTVTKRLTLSSTSSSGRFDLDQLYTSDSTYAGFSYDGPYPRLQMTNTVKVSGLNHNYYTFIKWMDEKGTEINENYTDTYGLLSKVELIDKKIGNVNKKKSLEMTFKSAVEAGIEQDVELYIYADFEGHTSASLTNIYIDDVSTGSGSFSETNQGLIDYTHTFSDPSIKTPKEHYQFLYWQYEKPTQEDDQVDPTKEYKDGDKMTYNLFYKPETWEATIIAHAWWQADVTLNLYDEELLSTQTDFESVSINVTPTKFGYTFIGWLDEDGNLVSDSTFYPNPKGTNPDPKVVNLYAKWERIMIDINVTKEWDDNNNSSGERPASITVELKIGDDVIETCKLNESNKWSCTFNVAQYDDTKEIEYTISEIKVDKYDSVITGSMKDGFKITNTYNDYGQGMTIPDELAEELPPHTGIEISNTYSVTSLWYMSILFCVVLFKRKYALDK